MAIKSPKKLLISIGVCLSAGFIGSFFTVPAIKEWYSTINKPIFTPPNWIFGPVWTTLFILMGISLYRVWIKGIGKKRVQFAIKFFEVHLLANILWSILFFGLKNPGLALLEIIILWVLIKYTIKLFTKIDKFAGKLLWPYLAWVSFATLLNFSIWLTN